MKKESFEIESSRTIDLRRIEKVQKRSNRVKIGLDPVGLSISEILIESITTETGSGSEDSGSVIVNQFRRDIVCNSPKLTGKAHDDEDGGRNFLNTIVGRYSNRLPAGSNSLKNKFDQTIQLDLEENESFEDGRIGNCLHSGKDGFDQSSFRRIGSDSEIVKRFESMILKKNNKNETRGEGGEPGKRFFSGDEKKEVEKAHFHLRSPSGHQGFPETIDVLATISIELNDDDDDDDEPDQKHHLGRLRFDLKAMISEEEGQKSSNLGTPINLTWHNGYILNDFSVEKIDQYNGIKDHKLWIDSDRYLILDDHQYPNGEIGLCKDSPLKIDFKTGDPINRTGLKTLGENLPPNGLDNCFLFNKREENDDEDGDLRRRRPKLIMKSPGEELSLSFDSNQSSIQIYSSNHFDSVKILRKSSHTFSKHLYKKKEQEEKFNQKYYGSKDVIFLEFQEPVSITFNEKLKRNLKELKKNNDDDANRDEVYDYDMILYKDEIYSNWFTIDIFILSK